MRPGRPLLLFGVTIALLSIAVYILQFSSGRLITPWYIPIATTLGAILVIASLVRARTIWRILSLILMVALAGLSWTFIFATKAPPYTGPVTVGKPIPPFSTIQAAGSPFTQQNLAGAPHSVLVSFRGRW